LVNKFIVTFVAFNLVPRIFCRFALNRFSSCELFKLGFFINFKYISNKIRLKYVKMLNHRDILWLAIDFWEFISELVGHRLRGTFNGVRTLKFTEFRNTRVMLTLLDITKLLILIFQIGVWFLSLLGCWSAQF